MAKHNPQFTGHRTHDAENDSVKFEMRIGEEHVFWRITKQALREHFNLDLPDPTSAEVAFDLKKDLIMLVAMNHWSNQADPLAPVVLLSNSF